MKNGTNVFVVSSKRIRTFSSPLKSSRWGQNLRLPYHGRKSQRRHTSATCTFLINSYIHPTFDSLPRERREATVPATSLPLRKKSITRYTHWSTIAAHKTTPPSPPPHCNTISPGKLRFVGILGDLAQRHSRHRRLFTALPGQIQLTVLLLWESW